MCCENEPCTNKETKLYVKRDSVTDAYVGAVTLCKECIEVYEELNDVTVCDEV